MGERKIGVAGGGVIDELMQLVSGTDQTHVRGVVVEVIAVVGERITVDGVILQGVTICGQLPR